MSSSPPCSWQGRRAGSARDGRHSRPSADRRLEPLSVIDNAEGYRRLGRRTEIITCLRARDERCCVAPPGRPGRAAPRRSASELRLGRVVKAHLDPAGTQARSEVRQGGAESDAAEVRRDRYPPATFAERGCSAAPDPPWRAASRLWRPTAGRDHSAVAASEYARPRGPARRRRVRRLSGGARHPTRRSRAGEAPRAPSDHACSRVGERPRERATARARGASARRTARARTRPTGAARSRRPRATGGRPRTAAVGRSACVWAGRCQRSAGASARIDSQAANDCSSARRRWSLCAATRAPRAVSG